MPNDKLSAEEQKFFETGDVGALPDNYADDAPPALSQDEPPVEVVVEVKDDPETKTEDVKDREQQPAGDQPNPEPKPKNSESVPLATFMEEKKGRQQLQQQLAELNEKFARADERLNMLTAPAKPAEQAKPNVPPNPDEDIIGATRWAVDRIAESEQQRQQQDQQRQEQQRQRQVQEQVVNTYAQLANERAQEDPTFTDAQNWLINSRYQELMAGGLPPDKAREAVHAEEFQLVYDSLVNKTHPADRITAIAKARGWAPAQQEQQQTQTDVDKLAAIAQGQAAAASLSSAGTSGTAKSGKVDAKALADMSDKEFADFIAKKGDDGFREALGG